MPSASDIGSYTIELEAHFVDDDQTKVQTSFSLEVISQQTDIANTCRSDEIMTTFIVNTISYQIGITGEILITPTWEPNSIEDCPSQYIMYRLVDNIQRRLTS